MLARELGAQRLYGLHNNYLELIRDLRHERRYLLHQTLNAALTARLQQHKETGHSSRDVRTLCPAYAYNKREVLCAATQVTYIGGEWTYLQCMSYVWLLYQQPQMGMHLQKCGDGQCRNAAVTIGDEPLEIHVTGGHYSWVEVGNAREGLDGCIAEGGLG